MSHGPNGDHYGDGVQPLDLIDSMDLGFYEGQVIKYVSRWEDKDGLKDLEKAAFYLNRLIDLAKPATVTIPPIVRQPLTNEEIIVKWTGQKASDKPPLTWTKQAAEDAKRGLPPEQQACR